MRRMSLPISSVLGHGLGTLEGGVGVLGNPLALLGPGVAFRGWSRTKMDWTFLRIGIGAGRDCSSTRGAPLISGAGLRGTSLCWIVSALRSQRLTSSALRMTAARVTRVPTHLARNVMRRVIASSRGVIGFCFFAAGGEETGREASS